MVFILCKHCKTIVKEGDVFECKVNICPLEQFDIIDEMTVEELTNSTDNQPKYSTDGGAAPSDSPIRIKMYEN